MLHRSLKMSSKIRRKLKASSSGQIVKKGIEDGNLKYSSVLLIGLGCFSKKKNFARLYHIPIPKQTDLPTTET
jgi:hypothetical protein